MKRKVVRKYPVDFSNNQGILPGLHVPWPTSHLSPIALPCLSQPHLVPVIIAKPLQGCYCAHALRFFPGQEPSEVLSAAAKGTINGCDTGMEAQVAYGGSGSGGGSAAGASGGSNGGSGACGRGGVGRRLVGSLEAELRHKGLFPVTTFTAEGTRWAGACGLYIGA